VDTSSTIVLGLLKDYSYFCSDAQKENITWSVQSSRETATFAHAVIAFKREQEAALPALKKPMEAAQEQNRRVEQGKFAEVKALADSPCEDSWGAKDERANAIMKMTREKFGSPVSPAMKEFIAHPSEATLRATGKSSVMAMTADEAEEAVETAEIFAKIAADGAAKGREYKFNAADQENLDWSETITREIVEFARAVATFKAAQQP
ncbi:MAG TPA: hypothetical protein VJK54_09195, partial [Chthoniobacterales bacterium]|nr:hypothetical protein [Chthoniobacterales bacterium]